MIEENSDPLQEKIHFVLADDESAWPRQSVLTLTIAAFCIILTYNINVCDKG